ncbi:helix-turn-helix domain-containing protein [uncultured Flavonifractor sp.]|uniref:helix-turn-helix domain-containing protein n=1 Tax=uncultured Flavonifractor sp. TaxID=1193534 RepID=UPI0026046BF5|nr:helix-turn-helix transcriptional regulator [uncultured Flavonifractor sp.]
MARVIRETGVSQGRAADRAGFSRAVFSNILRCKRKVYADEVCQIAEALGVSIEYLFAQSDNAN